RVPPGSRARRPEARAPRPSRCATEGAGSIAPRVPRPPRSTGCARPAGREDGNAGRPRRGGWPEDSCRDLGGVGGDCLAAAFEQRETDVEADLLVQPAEEGLGGGEVAVLEELVRRRPAAAEREVTARLPTALDAACDVGFELLVAFQRQHVVEG